MITHDLNRLSNRINEYPLELAYLFGSVAKGGSGSLSDIDIAVFIGKDIERSERSDLRLGLSNELSPIVGRKADLVVLNDTPVQLSYEIIKHGELIFCSDKSVKCIIRIVLNLVTANVNSPGGAKFPTMSSSILDSFPAKNFPFFKTIDGHLKRNKGTAVVI